MSSRSSCPVVQFSASSDRVKMVDIHPKEALFICTLYSGVINLWNYETHALVKSFDTSTGLPVRCARFIPRLQSFICGADDMNVRVFNYNTMERTKMFQAHDDFIRSIAVHEQLPIVLTASDDMTIRLWDWSKGWALQMMFEGHMHFCMAVTFNPKDPSTFASASLDCTVKVWNIANPVPNFQLEGHEDGVNCVEYYPRGDKPYLLSGSDDQTVRLWDYQTKACLQVFTFHTENVTSVLFHPDQPLIFTVAEDMEMKVISSETFRLLFNLDHSRMSRAWSLSAKRFTNTLIAGYDNGFAVFKVGEDKPVYSMDSNGRVLVAVGNEITRLDIRGIPADVSDGETLTIPAKDMGAVEVIARSILHGPNGQFFTVLGEGDYTVISSLSMRPKTYGQCLAFAWGPENGSYAVLETSMTLKLFKSFKERATLSLLESADQLFTGPLLGVRTASSIFFYDWATLSVVRQIDESPKTVQWSASNELVALVTDASIFLLKFNAAMVEEHLSQNGAVGPDGLDFSFDLVEEVEERVKEVTWVGDCLVFINQGQRLNYYIGGEVSNIAVLTRNQFLLGYLPKENRLFCVDKEKNITSYQLSVRVIEYMTAIVSEDFDTAAALLPSIPESARYKLAQFLQARGLLQLALEVTTEDSHRFDLAIQLKLLQLAQDITERDPSAARWKQVGDIALEQGLFDIAIRSFWNCGDFNGLLLIFSCLNDMQAISELGDKCLAHARANIAFTCFHMAQRHHDCVNLLCRTNKVGEAAFYARTYCPEMIEEIVAKWKVALAAIPRIREGIANPASYPNLFPMLEERRAAMAQAPAEEAGADADQDAADPRVGDVEVAAETAPSPEPVEEDVRPLEVHNNGEAEETPAAPPAEAAAPVNEQPTAAAPPMEAEVPAARTAAPQPAADTPSPAPVFAEDQDGAEAEVEDEDEWGN